MEKNRYKIGKIINKIGEKSELSHSQY